LALTPANHQRPLLETSSKNFLDITVTNLQKSVLKTSHPAQQAAPGGKPEVDSQPSWKEQ
jgi:hypothetical protein